MLQGDMIYSLSCWPRNHPAAGESKPSNALACVDINRNSTPFRRLELKRITKIALWSGSVLLALWVVSGAVVAYLVVMPKSRSFNDIAELEGHPVEAVTFEARDGNQVSGWYVPMESKRALVYAHGIGSDRRQHQSNMKFYLARGFAALSIDLRGHGKSEPDMVSMGWFERNDVLGAVDFLKRKGYEDIGLNGISLGAATIIYAFQDKPEVDFTILESPYETIDSALDNRLRMVGAPVWIAYSFRKFSPLFLGVGPEELRPLDWMREAHVPTLLLAGDNEAEIPVHETESLFAACAASIKRMHLFPGATHKHRLVRHHPEEYSRVVDEFLKQVYPAPAPESADLASARTTGEAEHAAAL